VFIRLTRAQLDPAKYESTASLRGELANIVRALPGCQGYQIAGNRKTGNLITVGTFDAEEHANYPREVLADVLGRLQADGLEQLQQARSLKFSDSAG
jgi:hypothetical protein